VLSIHTILVPTDLSGPSLQAFEVACSLARDRGARLAVLHVADTPEASSERDGLRDRLYRTLKPDSNVRVEWFLEVGDPARAIVRVASEIHADLIVMGASNSDLLDPLGRVADQVLRGCPCPVLTLTAFVPTEVPAPAALAAAPVGVS
jgi:nucleotide-binding universal stress UspA family protein